jgi:Peptidase propeptide and YPEB domain
VGSFKPDRKENTMQNRLTRPILVMALAVGLGVGSYGVASAASGSGTTTTTTSTSTAQPSASPGASAHHPWGNQRSDETLLTGDALAKVTAIAQAKVPGGTIVRVETDADGNAAYEAHMTKADGTPVTVYVDKNFNFVSVE